MITLSNLYQHCIKDNLAVTIPVLCIAGISKVYLSSQPPQFYPIYFPTNDTKSRYNKQTQMTIYNILIVVANADLVTKLISELESLYYFDEATDHININIPLTLSYLVLLSVSLARL